MATNQATLKTVDCPRPVGSTLVNNGNYTGIDPKPRGRGEASPSRGEQAGRPEGNPAPRGREQGQQNRNTPIGLQNPKHSLNPRVLGILLVGTRTWRTSHHSVHIVLHSPSAVKSTEEMLLCACTENWWKITSTSSLAQ